MIKNILKIIAIFIIGITGGIFSNRIFFYEQRPIYLTEKKEIIIQENLALKNAIEKVEKIVIGVKTQKKDKKILEGSALILTSDGLIITLSELIPPDSNFNFFLEGEKVPFQIIKRDLKENLALIKIEKNNLPIAGFANLEKLKLGERVFLVGATFEKESFKKIVNEGIIRAFNKEIIETTIFEKNNLAGSPLFDIEGKILGLNKIDKEEGRVITISISKIKSFANL